MVVYVEHNKDQEQPQTEPNMEAELQNIDPEQPTSPTDMEEQHNKEPELPTDIV